MMSLLRKAGLVVTGAFAVVLGVIVDELAWRRHMPRV